MTGVERQIALVVNSVSRVAPPVAARLAFELWRRPLGRGRVRATEREIHDAARVSVVEQRGRRVVTYAWGDGRRPVLLVHGWRSRASRFAPLVRALLEQGYSPVAYDAPGHGDTRGGAGTILDHQAVIGALAAEHGRFEGAIAHSLGVPFALYAVREGLAVDRVVAISGVSDFGYLVDAFCTRLGLRPGLDGLLRRRIERSLFGGDPDIWSRFSAERAAACDLLVIHDTVDEVVDAGQAHRLVRAYGLRAVLIETTGLGHSRIVGNAEVVAAAVGFLEEGAVAA